MNLKTLFILLVFMFKPLFMVSQERETMLLTEH